MPHLLKAVLSDTQDAERLLCQSFLKGSLSNNTLAKGAHSCLITQNAEIL